MRGGQRQVLFLLEALRGSGHASTLLTPKNSPLWGAAAERGFAVYRASLLQLWRLHRQVDLVHAHDARAHTLAALVPGGLFVVSRRVAFPVRRSVVSRWKYRRPARFLAISHFVAEQLQAAGIASEKIDVVYDATNLFSGARTWSAEDPVVALASGDPQKGRDLVEKAAALANIRVLFSSDLTRDLAHASAFLYITRSEGLGSAALLAMSMGVPVIASDVGGLREVFVDGVSGLFVSSEPQSIVSAIERVLSDSTLARRLSENARARIAERFTVDHLLRGTVAAYERALAA